MKSLIAAIATTLIPVTAFAITPAQYFFIKDLRSNYTVANSLQMPDSALLEFGKSACSEFSKLGYKEGSLTYMVKVMKESEKLNNEQFTSQMVGFAAISSQAAHKHLCPNIK